MYLAPLNYDRYFKKVFSDLTIAKRFIEDFLDVEIEQIENLNTDHLLTNNATELKFDFRCRIDKHDIIIEMQQWFKPDIIHRFYLYHAMNTALQLEGLTDKVMYAGDPKKIKIQDYRQLKPVITIVWMVTDTLSFSSNIQSFALFPENLKQFVSDETLWESKDAEKIIDARNEVLTILQNNSKNIHWMSTNRLIYAFQPNIVANPKFTKYKAWFELAQKTLSRIQDKFAYAEFEKDEVLREVVRRLCVEPTDQKEWEYIQNEEELYEKAKRYDEGIRAEGKAEGLAEGKAEGLVEGKAEGKAEAESKLIPIIEAERLAKIEAQEQAQLALEKAQLATVEAQETAKIAAQKMHKLIKRLIGMGGTPYEIAEELGISLEEVKAIADLPTEV
jgi:hypothetical protein